MATTTAPTIDREDVTMDEMIMTQADDLCDPDDMMKAFIGDTDDSMMADETDGTPANVRQVSDSTGSASSDQPAEVKVHTPFPVMTGRPSIMLYLSCNPDYLSEYQCLIRKNIELFEAKEADVNSKIKGRNKPIVLGQVGIRCRHCAHIYPVEKRERGAVYYPHTLVGIYQAAQILSQGHLLELCPFVEPDLRRQLQETKVQKSYATAGKEYWASTAKVLGVYEDQYGLRFEERLGVVRHSH